MAIVSRFLVTVAASAALMACGSRALPDPLDLYEANYGGTVPVEANVVYPAGADVALCSPPDWGRIHPDRSDVEWPIIRSGVVGEVGLAHPDAPNLSGPVFAAFNSDLMETTDAILAVTTWSGTDVPCGDTVLETGSTVIVGGYFEPETDDAEVFEQLSAFVDDAAPSPWDDLDVAVNAGTTPDL